MVVAITIILVIAINQTFCWVHPVTAGKFDDVPYDIEICNFGSSHGGSDFDYSEIEGERCFNFGLTSQSLSYDLRILKHYKDHIKKGCVVYIPVSYFSFWGIPETKTDEFAAKNKRYYLFLDKEEIKEYDYMTALCEKYMPSLTAYEYLPRWMIEGLISKIRNSQNDRISLENEDVEQKNLNENIDMVWSAQDAYQRHFIKEKKDAFGKRIYNEEEVNALYEIVKICQESDFIPVLVTTPFTWEYVNIIDEKDAGFWDEFNQIIDGVCTKTGVEYRDYSRDERFKNHELFRDADHLNDNGARKFTNTIIEETIRIESKSIR